ncbi:MAG: hypothetical protein HYZ53_17860 [Planctomycetes bacterium]|nr:hypothetical protein [Planctomycetota bacterium]
MIPSRPAADARENGLPPDSAALPARPLPVPSPARTWLRGPSPHSPRRVGAFTLIELMVSIGLSTLMVGTVALILTGSSQIAETASARLSIYANARTLIEIIERDLAGVAPLTQGQRFILENFDGDTTQPLPNTEGLSWRSPAGDRLQFRANIPIHDPLGVGAPDRMDNRWIQKVHILYRLVPDSDPAVNEVATNFATSRTVGFDNNTGNPRLRWLFVLRRLVYRIPQVNPNFQPTLAGYANGFAPFVPPPLVPGPGNPPPNVTVTANDGLLTTGPQDPNLLVLDSGDIGQYILSMNIEALWARPTGGVGGNEPVFRVANFLPPGYSSPIDDPQNETLPYALRFTFRMTDGAPERQERILSRVFFLPQSPY